MFKLSLIILFPLVVAVCHICGHRGNKSLLWPHVKPLGKTKTCAEQAMLVAKYETTDEQCIPFQKEWKPLCCTTKRPDGQDTSLIPVHQEVPVVKYIGPYKPCHICRDGDYPATTTMVLEFLHIGTGSCKQYYVKGLAGEIQNHLCSVVQYYAYEPCGCGAHNPYLFK